MIDLSNYGCDKCKREFSWHCKHCWHTADKKPTRFEPKKKTGYGQVDLEKVVAPISTTTFEAHCTPKQVRIFAVGTEKRLDALLSEHEDMVRIENADIYWSEKDGMLAVCTTREWTDYLVGRRNSPFDVKENNKNEN